MEMVTVKLQIEMLVAIVLFVVWPVCNCQKITVIVGNCSEFGRK